jgi:folate-binding protein YgfZ
MSFYDPRLRAIGCRIICPTDSLEIEKDIVNYKMTSEDYDIIRLLYGIPEGPDEVEGSLPLNMNFQLLNYINFSKGCYIGQELTQRTYHTGVIRKIVMPFICTEKLKFKIGDEEEGMVLKIFITKNFIKLI